MREKALEAAAGARRDPEAAAFLEWLADDNFTFLGYRDSSGAGLGILRDPQEPRTRRRDWTATPDRLTLTKANTRSTVHRAAYLDYVGIGERRFLGLYTHTAYRASPTEIPVLRRRVAAVLERAAFPPDSHNEKGLLEILDTYPRDELFQISDDELFEAAIGHPAPRRAPAAAAVRPPRPVRALLLAARVRAARPLQHREPAPDRGDPPRPPRARRASTTRRASPSRCSCGCTSWPTSSRARCPSSTRARWRCCSWPRRARGRTTSSEALLDELGEARGGELFQRYGDAFPAAYRADWVARSALADIVHIEELPDERRARHQRSTGRSRRARACCAPSCSAPGAPLMLSDVLPLFENMGVQVADERPYPITPARRATAVWIYDFGLDLLRRGRPRRATASARASRTRSSARGAARSRTTPTTGSCWAPRSPGARSPCCARSASTCARRASPSATATSSRRSSRTPQIARLLVALFQARFDPRRSRPRRTPRRWPPAIEEAIDAVESLDQDQILRMFLDVIRAMLRTNYFQTGQDEAAEPPVLQARPVGAALAPPAAPALRDLRLLAAHRGRAPPRRPGGARRHPLVGPPRGLPHRGARPDEGPDGEERGDRPGRAPRAASWSSARRPSARGPARGGGGVLPDVHPRPARPDRQHRRRRGGAAARSGALRRRRPVSRRGRRQGHGDVLGHRERDRARGGLLARRRVRLRRVDRLRPQEDGHHGPRRVGVRQAPLPRARARRPVRGLHGRRHRRHVGRRVRERHAAVAPHPAGRARSTTGTSSSTRSPDAERELRGAQAAVRAARARRGTTTTRDADLGGRRRVRPHREVDPALAAGARGARHRGGGAEAERADPGAAARAGGPALERRHRHLREGGLRDATRTSGDKANDAVRVDAADLRAKVVGEGGNLGPDAARRGSSTRWPAGGSTPTRSTTPAASTARTAR